MPIDPTDNRYVAHGPIADLAAAATTADAVAKINAILAALRQANVISQG